VDRAARRGLRRQGALGRLTEIKVPPGQSA
jgi:hypothetical protein